VALLIVVVGANVALFFQLWITFTAALIVAAVFAARARTRIITFDASADLLTVQFRALFEQQTVLEKPLREISRAYLRKDDDDSTQIVLVDVLGGEMGLSVHSQEMMPWKEPLVIAINAILHEAHKDDPDGDEVI